ncbi:MAG: hypothetical protein BGO76_07860 [Caedibacter sp. 38-128]|nr:MAG: hypothetical protein BGO76_07860 [Caedibacter sp. 38-128]
MILLFPTIFLPFFIYFYFFLVLTNKLKGLFSFIILIPVLRISSDLEISPNTIGFFHPKAGERRKESKGANGKTLLTSYPFTPSSSLLILQDLKPFLGAPRKA